MNALLREIQREIINRPTMVTVAQQKDPTKRARDAPGSLLTPGPLPSAVTFTRSCASTPTDGTTGVCAEFLRITLDARTS